MPSTPYSSAAAGLSATLLELHRLALSAREPDIYAAAIEAAVALTGSEIGYFHLVNEDQVTIELGTWSAGTLRQCQAVYDRHYPLDAAGVWADAARHRRACIHNDYQALANKRGYPQGHVHLIRHLGVPVIEDERVVLLVGVGNKPLDYDEEDQARLQAIADEAWTLISHSRRDIALEVAERQLHELQGLATLCLWQWDPEEQKFSCEQNLRELFLSGSDDNPGNQLEQFLRVLNKTGRERVQELLHAPSADTSFDVELHAVRADGEAVTLQFSGSAHPRSQGHGLLLQGFLQDITERRRIAHILYQANHDPLTALANRTALITELATRLRNRRREPADTFAVHFLDLDRFKPVNDYYGHAVGDRVLQIAAKRLLRTVRKDDLVARIGGDEMVVVQRQASRRDSPQTLAGKIIAAISEPYDIAGEKIEIGVSIGIVLSHASGESAEELLARADRAMYQAKQAGRGKYQLDRG